MPVSFVGVDVSKLTLDIFVEVDGQGKHQKFLNCPAGFKDMNKWFQRQKIKDVHVCMEATGSYWEKFAAYSFEEDWKVSVLNPSCIKRFAQSELKRTKTDKVDAGVICRFAKAMQPGLWTPPPKEVQVLQALSRRLHSLMKMRRQELNRKEAEYEKVVKTSIGNVVKMLDAEIAKVRKRIKQVLMRHDHLKKKHDLLVSIPGVGEETAHLVLAEVPNLDFFEEAKQLVAFAGLAPREIRSGTSVRGRSSLSKMGNSRLRQGLYMCALVAMKWNPIISAFCERLLQRGKPPMKVLGAAMRKMLHIIYGVLKSGKPFRADLASA